MDKEVIDPEPLNTWEHLNAAGKVLQEGTVLHDEDPEYLEDHERDSVWGDSVAND